MQVSLLELQQAFRHAMVAGDAESIAGWVQATREEAAQRVAIYRNNSQTNMRNALRSDYPVVERLVGNAFFDHAAAAFVAATPSLSGDVNDYGKSFPHFLAAFPAAASVPYLADVARLERSWSEAFLAAEAAPADFTGLGGIAQERLGAIRFRINPAARLLASSFPVLTIWRMNQAGYEGEDHLRLDGEGELVLLLRRETDVAMHLLEPGEYVWLVALHAGSTLTEAVDAAMAAQADFDLSLFLPRHLSLGTFAGFTEMPHEN